MSLEWRALDQAATRGGPARRRGCSPRRARSPAPRTTSCAASPSSSSRAGTGFPPVAGARASPQGLPEAARAPPSRSTTRRPPRSTTPSRCERARRRRAARGRAHRRARALLRPRRTRWRRSRASACPRSTSPAARSPCCPRRRSTRATLAAGRRVPAASLYLDRRPRDASRCTASESRLEWIAIADNLRLAELDTRLNEEAVAAGRGRGRRTARTSSRCGSSRKLLKAARGAGEEKADRLDYTFRVADGRVSIEPRRRGTPVDTLVAELMIHVNSTWGKLLAERGYDAHLPQPEGRQDAHGGGARRPRVAGRVATTPGRARRCAASADLANQRQLVGAAARRASPPTRATSSPPRRATSRPPTRPTPSTSACSSATGASVPAAGGHRGGRARRVIRDELVRIDGHAAGVPRHRACPRRRPGSACAWLSARSTSGRRTSCAATRGNNRYNSASCRDAYESRNTADAVEAAFARRPRLLLRFPARTLRPRRLDAGGARRLASPSTSSSIIGLGFKLPPIPKWDAPHNVMDVVLVNSKSASASPRRPTRSRRRTSTAAATPTRSCAPRSPFPAVERRDPQPRAEGRRGAREAARGRGEGADDAHEVEGAGRARSRSRRQARRQGRRRGARPGREEPRDRAPGGADPARLPGLPGAAEAQVRRRARRRSTASRSTWTTGA